MCQTAICNPASTGHGAGATTPLRAWTRNGPVHGCPSPQSRGSGDEPGPRAFRRVPETPRSRTDRTIRRVAVRSRIRVGSNRTVPGPANLGTDRPDCQSKRARFRTLIGIRSTVETPRAGRKDAGGPDGGLGATGQVSRSARSVGHLPTVSHRPLRGRVISPMSSSVRAWAGAQPIKDIRSVPTLQPTRARCFHSRKTY